MPAKKSRKTSNRKDGNGSRPVTREVLEQYIDKILSNAAHNKKVLEAKIEYSRQDFGEHLRSIQSGLNKRIDSVDQRLNSRMDKLEEGLELTQKALKATRDELKSDMHSMESRLSEISEKIDRGYGRLDDHETRITALETTPQ